MKHHRCSMTPLIAPDTQTNRVITQPTTMPSTVQKLINTLCPALEGRSLIRALVPEKAPPCESLGGRQLIKLLHRPTRLNIETAYDELARQVIKAGPQPLLNEIDTINENRLITTILEAGNKGIIKSSVVVEQWDWGHMHHQLTFVRSSHDQILEGCANKDRCVAFSLPTGAPSALGIALSIEEQQRWETEGAQPVGPRYCILCMLKMIKTMCVMISLKGITVPQYHFQMFMNPVGVLGGYKPECCFTTDYVTYGLVGPVINLDIMKLSVVWDPVRQLTYVCQDSITYTPNTQGFRQGVTL